MSLQPIVREVLTWATATLEAPKRLTREQENMPLMSAIRQQALDITRQLTSENAPPAFAATALRVMPVWGEALAYWSETPQEFLPLYEEFAANWERLRQSSPAGKDELYGQPLEYILLALDHTHESWRSMWWGGGAPSSTQRANWQGLIEPVQAALVTSDDPARRLTAAWLGWRMETVRSKKQELLEEVFRQFATMSAQMSGDARLFSTFQSPFYDRNVMAWDPLRFAQPNFATNVNVTGMGDFGAWPSKEWLEVTHPIVRKLYENGVPTGKKPEYLLPSLRAPQAEEMAGVLLRYANGGIADPVKQEKFKAEVAATMERIKTRYQVTAEAADRPVIVLENPWKDQVRLALARGEELESVEFNSNFVLRNGRVIFCTKLHLKNRGYHRQPNVLFSVEPWTNETKFWRLPDGAEENFLDADVRVSGNLAVVIPAQGYLTGPILVAMDTGRVHGLTDLRLGQLALDTDDQNQAIVAYNTSGRPRGGDRREKRSLGRIDPVTGKMEIIASNRRVPPTNLLDGEEFTISDFAWDAERSRLLVQATRNEGTVINRVRYLAGTRNGSAWNFVVLDDKDLAPQVISRVRARDWKPVFCSVHYEEIVMGKGNAYFAKNRWIDLDCPIRKVRRKKDTPPMALAFDVLDAPELDEAFKGASDTEFPSVLRIQTMTALGCVIAPVGPNERVEKFWFVPMERIEAYVRAGNHIRK